MNSSKKLSVDKMSENLAENHSCSFEQSVGEDSPRVSVIVPVYKVEKYLPECIDSILAQTFTDFELILVDDGSPDNSGKICDDYATRDSRIRVFHKENGGVSSARNLGLDNARGKWIAFADSDDTVGEKYLENLLPSGNDELVVGGAIVVERDGRMRAEQRRDEVLSCRDAIRIRKIYRSGAPWAKIFRRDIIAKNSLSFNENIVFSEDLVFLVDYLKCISKVRYRSISLDYYYHLRVGGLTMGKVPFESDFLLFKSIRSSFGVILCGEFDCDTSLYLKRIFFRAISRCYRCSSWRDLFFLYRNTLNRVCQNGVLRVCSREVSPDWKWSSLHEKIFLMKRLFLFDVLLMCWSSLRFFAWVCKRLRGGRE